MAAAAVTYLLEINRFFPRFDGRDTLETYYASPSSTYYNIQFQWVSRAKPYVNSRKIVFDESTSQSSTQPKKKIMELLNGNKGGAAVKNDIGRNRKFTLSYEDDEAMEG